MNALIIDDEPLTLSALSAAVNWNECGIEQIFTASSAAEAKDVINTHSVQLLFVDIEMPGESGIQLLKWVNLHKPNIIYTIITGHSDFHYVHAALQLQSVDYLLKPVQVDTLLTVIEKMIEKARGKEEAEKIKRYAQQWLSEQKTEIERKAEPKQKPEELAGEVEEYIYSHLTENISLEKISSHFYMSSDYLNRLYKKCRGTTIKQYLIRARMDLAAKLLMTSNRTATEIAGYLGYASYPSFVNTFKKIYGVSPASYLDKKRDS